MIRKGVKSMEDEDWKKRYFGLLDIISTASYGKAVYYLQADGTVYSIVSEKTMTLDEAEEELREGILQLQ